MSERAAAACFFVGTVAALALAAVYWAGGQPQAEGALLGVALTAVGVGLVVWANTLMPQGPYAERRAPLASSAAEREELEADAERGGVLSRRRLLVGSLSASVIALGAAFAFPIRSLGPNPGKRLLRTPWRTGRRLIDEQGRVVRAQDVPPDGLVTVFPEGHPGSADGQAVLVRVAPDLLHPKADRADWSPDGLLAFSKVCTHAGCPVGLYEAASHQLLCPCHQSVFDVLDAARPVSGPAAWPLPQLPLSIDADGTLRAGGDFSGPVGPGWWRE